MANIRKKSAYAEKQGRARKSAGDDHDGPRTRYRKTSPLSSEYVSNPGHRLALYFARGERLERERLQRFRGVRSFWDHHSPQIRLNVSSSPADSAAVYRAVKGAVVNALRKAGV